MTAAPAAGAWRRRIRAATPSGSAALVAFSAAAVGAGLGRALLTTYLPVLLERIRDAPGLIGTVMLVNTAAGLLVPLVVGVWSDRLRDGGHGRTMPFVLGGSVLAAGGLLAVALGHASSYLALAAFAAVAYAGLNAVTTGHRALIPENFDEEERAAATGGEEVAMLAGTLLGVVAGGFLIERGGWMPFALGALALPLLALPTVRRMRGRERPPVPVARRSPGVRYYLRAAARPGGRLILAAQALWVLGYVGLPPFFVLYAQRVLDLRPSIAGLLLAGFGLVSGAAMLLAGIAKVERQRALLLAGAAAMGAGLLAVAASSSLALVAAALLPVAIGFGVLTTLGFPVYANFIPRGEEGAYSALYFSVRSISSAVALPVAGWTIALTGSYRSLFVLGGCVTLAALVPLAALSGRRWRPGERARRALRYGAGLAVATAALLGLGMLIAETALLDADKEAFSLLYGAGSSPALIDRLLVDPHIRNYALLTLLAAFVPSRLRRGSALRAAAIVAGAGLVAYAMVRTSWALWERPRPEVVIGTPPANDHKFDGLPSFPSGHVAVTTALVASIGALVPVLRLPLWGYALVIAATRVSYGAHFPSDVAGGLVVGVLAAHATLAVLADPRPSLRTTLRELLFTQQGSRRLRRLARALGAAALAVFAVLLATVGPPHSPDGGLLGASIEHGLQLGLLALAAAGVAAGWYRDALAAAALAVTGLALGVLAALEYNPAFAVAACLAFFIPATMFAFAWHPVRTRRAAASAALIATALLALGAFAALEVHSAAYGPAHPQSPLTAPPTWRVQWAWSGAVTARSATVNARLNADGRVRLLVGTRADLRDARASRAQRSDGERNQRLLSFAARNLRPSTRYFYGLEFEGRVDRNRIGRFTTFAAGRQSFKIAIGGCARVASNGAVFDAIRRERPLMFLALGDLFYANIDQNARGRFLDQYDRTVGSPAQGALYRSAPIAYVWDDHDFGPDGADASSASRPAARWAYGAAVPHYALPSGAGGTINQAFTIGRVRFLVLDTRSARTGDSMLGAAQTRWLKRELLAGRDRFALTVLVSSVPWIGRAAPGADGWAAFASERAALSRFIARHDIRRLVMLGGDAHMIAIDDGSHSDYSGTGRAGFPVFHAAALDRPGGEKGGPYSEGTFPGAGQYGTMTVDDRGDRLEVLLSGRDHRGRELVRHAFAVPAPRP